MNLFWPTIVLSNQKRNFFTLTVESLFAIERVEKNANQVNETACGTGESQDMVYSKLRHLDPTGKKKR